MAFSFPLLSLVFFLFLLLFVAVSSSVCDLFSDTVSFCLLLCVTVFPVAVLSDYFSFSYFSFLLLFRALTFSFCSCYMFLSVMSFCCFVFAMFFVLLLFLCVTFSLCCFLFCHGFVIILLSSCFLFVSFSLSFQVRLLYLFHKPPSTRVV